ncbi:MAG: hypothetical protein KQH79_17465 [Bacteroidetes bacterium]|nr:hypothetical protein [Bacteroidota bacterium]
MKNFTYNININQKAAYEIFGESLDHTDHFILSYCIQYISLYQNKKIKRDNQGREFAFINAKYILKQNPILKLSPNTVLNRLNKLVKHRALERIKDNNNNCFYKLTNRIEGFYFYNEASQKTGDLHKKDETTYTKKEQPPSQNSDKYYNTKNNNTHISMPDDNSYPNHPELKNKILKFFGFSAESDKHHRQTVLVQQCINIQKFNKQLDYFEEQVNSYIKFKKLSEQTVHSFHKWIGSLSEHFENGAWNQENWTAKLKKHSEKSENKAVYKKAEPLKPHDYLSK